MRVWVSIKSYTDIHFEFFEGIAKTKKNNINNMDIISPLFLPQVPERVANILCLLNRPAVINKTMYSVTIKIICLLTFLNK